MIEFDGTNLKDVLDFIKTTYGQYPAKVVDEQLEKIILHMQKESQAIVIEPDWTFNGF